MDHDDQLQPEDTLIDRGVDDVLDEGYSPPERPYGGSSFDSGPESLDQLLAEEEPDPAMQVYDPDDKDEQQRSEEAERETEFPQHDEVGRTRAGRLVPPDQGFGEHLEADLVADDVGIDFTPNALWRNTSQASVSSVFTCRARSWTAPPR